MKLIKTGIRSQIKQFSLSHLMKIAINTLETLSDVALDTIITVWNRKPRKLLYECIL